LDDNGATGGRNVGKQQEIKKSLRGAATLALVAGAAAVLFGSGLKDGKFGPQEASAATPAAAAQSAAGKGLGAAVTGAERQTIVKALAMRGLRDEQVESVTRSPDERFDLVVARQAGLQGDMLYVSRDGRYAFAGPLWDLKTGENLSAAAEERINSIDFSKLPLDLALKSVRGTGARKIVVFADPNCPYCKRLEQGQLSGIKDLTVYTFVIPILSDDSRAKTYSIDCSKDAQKAWSAWMTQNQAPTAAPCQAGADRANKSTALANSLRVTATPMIFFEDGSRMAGAQSAEDIEKRLDKAQAAKTASK
jgi:thiol:disulfide interchange protein DsbC